ncbi:hypothetical protein CC1G_14022 [Coprinopsis cinerea okayama7|uniref:Uncharacterized protein n=1 Tax=Coprinopsis cinerea (strain Okayama-7 / 130 / ATCC MYA-4618 / FGSC 9003) TaxID=240176 RepID=D6RL12_COPC7|nr:hypothetical protein CC1G_14022 [Coprinopsis cinerea okayama7\|eukprot:XP_002911984.1 hypothetical protein CC1G_14022 [Coprinopsis cinerea okayama7\
MRSLSVGQFNSLLHYLGLRVLASAQQYLATSEPEETVFREGFEAELQALVVVIYCAKMRFPGITPPEFLQRLLLINLDECYGPLCILDGVLASLPDDIDVSAADAGPNAWWAPGASPRRLTIEEIIDCWNQWQTMDRPSPATHDPAPGPPATLERLRRTRDLLKKTVGLISEELESSMTELSAATEWKKFLVLEFPEIADVIRWIEVATRALDRPLSSFFISTEAPTQWLAVAQWIFDRVHTVVYEASQLPLSSEEKAVFIRYVQQEFKLRRAFKIFAQVASGYLFLCLDELIENRFTWACSSVLLYFSTTEDMLFDGTLRGIFGPPETPRQANWLKAFLQREKPPPPRWQHLLEECNVKREYPERDWSYPRCKVAATRLPQQITQFDKLIFTLEEELAKRKERVAEMRAIKEAWENALS